MKFFKLIVFTIFVILSCHGTASAQSSISQIDDRIVDVYGADRTAGFLETQPQFIEYLNYYVQNAYTILYNIPTRKLSQFEDISTIWNTRTGKNVTHEEIFNLNILLLSIKRGNDEYLTYKVGDSGTVIVFIAPNTVRTDYNQMKKNE